MYYWSEGAVYRHIDGVGDPIVVDGVPNFGSWSPWEHGIVYLEEVAGGRRIVAMDERTGQISPLVEQTEDRPLSRTLAASTDGRWVYYTQLDRSGSDVMAVDLRR